MFRVEPFNQWPKWSQDSFNEIVDCEDSINVSFFDGADQWTDAALIEVIKNSFPTLLRLRDPVSGSYCLGAITGHQEWIIDNIDELLPSEEVLDLMIENLNRYFEQALKFLSPEQRIQLIAEIRNNQAALLRMARTFDKICRLKKELIIKTLNRSVNNARGNERLEFLSGYTKAYSKPAIRHPDDLSPREKMLSAMLLGWRDVQTMKNRTVLRQSLGRLFNNPEVYNHDFVQGICKDIGLKLASRGRQ